MVKDFSDIIDQSNETGIPVTFKLTSSGTNKLALVKAIKSATNLGIKEAKDIADFPSNSDVAIFKRKMTIDELNTFKRDLSICNASYCLNDDTRNRKIINLGIYDKFDLIEEISNIAIFNVCGKDYETVKSFFSDILSNFNEEQLKQIYDKYESGF